MEEFYSIGRRIRSLAEKTQPFGSAGGGSGFDGELSSSLLFNVTEKLKEIDPTAFTEYEFGLDIGSGSGVTAFLLCYGLRLSIVGFEMNGHRSRYCWDLQKSMFHDECSDPEKKKLAEHCRFFNSDAVTGLPEVFGSGINSSCRNVVLTFMFRDGWVPEDINKTMIYLTNNAVNLKWFIIDMSATRLKECLFEGHVIQSFKFSGRMVKSSNSRTIYLHQVKMLAGKTSSSFALYRTPFSLNSLAEIEECLKQYWDIDENERALRKIKCSLHQEHKREQPLLSRKRQRHNEASLSQTPLHSEVFQQSDEQSTLQAEKTMIIKSTLPKTIDMMLPNIEPVCKGFLPAKSTSRSKFSFNLIKRLGATFQHQKLSR